MTENKFFDVIIIGGSYAGLSAAMALGRSLRNVLIIDNGNPCNIQTPHSHNFLTQDGKTPREISDTAKAQVESYDTVKFYKGTAIEAKKTENGFEIKTEDGESFESKKLILATGVKDEIPDIKGFAECWGISLIHCPYCHGYEYRNKKTGIIATGERAVHLASLVRNLTGDVTVFTRGKAEFDDEQREKLSRNSINIIEDQIAELKHENGNIKSIVLDTQGELPFDAVYGGFSFQQHSEIPKMLGCEFIETGHIKTDHFQKTNIPGVFVCGDNSSMMRAVSSAVMTGNVAGAMVNAELVTDCF